MGSAHGQSMAARELSSRSIVDYLPTSAKELIAGGLAGGFAKTVVAPLERTKILYQTQYTMFRTLGIKQSIHLIYKKEGLLGFYKGNGASVIRVVPYAALHFMTYEQYRRWLVENYPKWTSQGPFVDLLAGSMAGGTAVLCTYPLDLARTTLAYQVKDAASGGATHKSIKDVFSSVMKVNGVRGLYRGLSPTLYGMLPYAGLKFYIYESLRGSIPDNWQSSIPVKLGCGATAGLVAQTFTYPLDVVRRQMQVQAVENSKNGYASTMDGLISIARQNGVKHLFAGLSINYIKLVPSVAIGFATYDCLKSCLRVPPRNSGQKNIVT